MLEKGLLAESECFYRFCAGQLALPTAAQAIGYKELFPYFEHKLPLSEAVENMKRESRRYAKRQITWFRREPEILFLCQDDFAGPEELLREGIRLVEKFRKGGAAL